MEWEGRISPASLQPSQASTYHQTRTSARPDPSVLDSELGSRLRESCLIHTTSPAVKCWTKLGMAFLHFSRGTRSLAQMSKSRAGHGQRGRSHITSAKIWDFLTPSLPLSAFWLELLLCLPLRQPPSPSVRTRTSYVNAPKVEQITRSDRTDRKFHVKAFAADGEGGRNFQRRKFESREKSEKRAGLARRFRL